MTTPVPPSIVDEAARAAAFARERAALDPPTLALIDATEALVAALRGVDDGALSPPSSLR